MKKFLSLIFIAIIFNLTAYGQQLGNQSLAQLKKSPAGSNILAFLNAINDKEVFTEKDIPALFANSLIQKIGAKRLLEVMEDIKLHDGQIELYEANRTDVFRYDLKALGLKHKGWLDIALTVEENPPYKINGILGVDISSIAPKTKTPILSPGKAAEFKKRTSTITDKKLKELDEWITKRTSNNQFSGVVLIAKDFRPIFHKAYGFASKRYKVPNQLDTKFRYASVGKIITATAILQLAEKGLLALDDKLGKYIDLNDFKDPRTKEITIRHLLTHTSGWSYYWENKTFHENLRSLRVVTDYMNFIKDIPLEFDPGTKGQYSNTGYVVLGAVIEAVTKMDYYDYVDKHIYGPVGMTNSGSFQIDHIAEGLATPYTNYNHKREKVGEGFPYETTLISPPRGVPAGGSCSTTTDMLKFLEAIANNTILNQESEDLLRSRFGTKGMLSDFIFHNGGGPGQSAWVQADVANGYSIIILSNYDHPTGEIVVKHIGETMELDIW